MASRKRVTCGPCQQGGLTNKANIWCNKCDEGLCTECLSHHKRFKLTHDHMIIDIETYESPISSFKTECDTHGQTLRLYCPSHYMPCCDECISSSHSTCTGIKSLASIVEKTNIEKSKESVESNINSNFHFLNKLANSRSENIKRGEHQYEDIKVSISKIRKDINEHLDHLERAIYKEAEIIWGQKKSRLTGSIREIEDKQKILTEVKDNLHTLTTHASTLQSFLGLNQIEQQVHQCQLYVKQQNETRRDVDIRLKENHEMKQILSKVQSLISIGEITLRKETSMNIESTEQPNINSMIMHIKSKEQINLKNITSISDMTYLMDGRVIIVEQFGKVHILSSDFRDQKRLTRSDGAWSVTQMKQDTIAISYPHWKAIKMFNVENETQIKVITLDKSCWGLCFSNNALVVGLAHEEIRIIDLEGQTLKSIGFNMHQKSQLCHLLHCNDKVIYSDYHGKAVTCIDESGKRIWRYKHDLLGPKGLSMDTFGNIIVADMDSNRIIVISKDGLSSKVLITTEDTPGFICFNKSSGFICHDLGFNFTKVRLFYK